MILGSGPNRIGQGIEFDYCCCHAAFALKEEGLETVMVNCNPETVSTDYDSVDRLYFEPLTLEDVSAVIEKERAAGGEVACIVQFGGQTPLKLALGLQRAGVEILGTSPDSIDLAEDRKRFAALLWELGIPQAPSGIATSREQARDVAAKIGYPLVVRPSYVLGGRAMAIVYDAGALDRYMTEAVDASPEHPVLIDKFLEDAFELDVDAVADSAGAVVIGGVMEHIEQAGIHSGDSSCVLPPYLVAERHLVTIRDYTRRVARALNVIGLLNAQFAIKDDTVYVLEVNPRASRTVPYLSKATGVPLAKVAARVMAGRTLGELGLVDDLDVAGVFVKAPVFPFVRFPGVDTILGPEMKSTGEVMGAAATFGSAYAKAQLAAGRSCPTAAPRSSASTTRTRPTSCPSRATSRGSGSRCSRPGAPPPTCGRTGSSPSSSTRSTRAVPTSATGCSTARSTSSSTPRSAASRSSTTAPSAASPRCWGSPASPPSPAPRPRSTPSAPSRTRPSTCSRCRSTTPRSPGRSRRDIRRALTPQILLHPAGSSRSAWLHAPCHDSCKSKGA